ncbi:hypothetical protein GIB67_024674, partial [Kingdonia uniflora]
EDISSSISAQMFEFCDFELLIPETFGNSDVSSCSNCFEDNSSYTTNLSSSLPLDSGRYNSNTTSNTSINNNTNTNTNDNLSLLFDTQEENDNDISASINFMSSPTFQIPPLLTNSEDQQQYDLSSLQHQIPDHIINGFSTYSPDQVIPLNGTPLPPVYEDECLPSFSYNVNLDPSSPSCSFIDANVGQFFTGNLNTGFPGDGSCMFPGSLLMGSELQGQDLDFQGDNGGVYSPQSVQQGYSSSDMQLLNGSGNSTLTSEISNLEESTYKVGRLSVEERKEKIHRYMKKRNERNFSKKIKYACRKTLADSRPRVRGRFAKNDDFGEMTRANCSSHDEDDDEIVVKEENDMVDSSDIFAHISGVNSFKCSYPIQSWI